MSDIMQKHYNATTQNAKKNRIIKHILLSYKTWFSRL